MIASGVIIAVSVVLGLIRVAGHKSQAYQAAAHLWVGGLCGACWVAGGDVRLWCVIGLSVVEVFCFLYFRRASKPPCRTEHEEFARRFAPTINPAKRQD